MEVVEGEIVGQETHKSVEDVNNVALDRLYELIQEADPEQMPSLIECLAKYNSSVKGNNTVFTPKESEEAKTAREQANLIKEALK